MEWAFRAFLNLEYVLQFEVCFGIQSALVGHSRSQIG